MAYHRSPSRIKYEKAHPNISVRLSKDLKEYLTSISVATGKSYPALVREGLESRTHGNFVGKPITELSQKETTILIQTLESLLAELKKHEVGVKLG